MIMCNIRQGLVWKGRNSASYSGPDAYDVVIIALNGDNGGGARPPEPGGGGGGAGSSFSSSAVLESLTGCEYKKLK